MYSSIGIKIAKLRMEQGVTSEDVCYGLCSISTYNRYESGKLVPDKFMIDSIMERLGKNPNKLIFAVSDFEYSLIKKRLQLEKDVKNKDKKELLKQINEYEIDLKQRSKQLHNQFVSKITGEYFQREGNIDKAIHYYKKALSYTNKKEYSSNCLYTLAEYDLLRKIYSIQKDSRLIVLFNDLKKRKDNDIIKIKYYGSVLYDVITHNISVWNNEEKLEYINEVISFKKRINQSLGLSKLLEIKKMCGGELDRNEQMLLELDENIEELCKL